MTKYEDFCSALINFKDNQYQEPYDTVIMTGLVGIYEICLAI